MSPSSKKKVYAFKSIHDAITERSLSGVMDWLESFPNDLDKPSREAGCTAITWAVVNKNTEVVDDLLMKGASLITLDRRGLNALHEACISGDVEMVKHLESHKPNWNSICHKGYTALTYASRFSRLEVMEYLISFGASVRHRDPEDLSLLHHAVLHAKNIEPALCLVGGGLSLLEENQPRPFEFRNKDVEKRIKEMMLAEEEQLQLSKIVKARTFFPSNTKSVTDKKEARSKRL